MFVVFIFSRVAVQNMPGRGALTHCGLVMPYDDIDMGQNWHW